MDPTHRSAAASGTPLLAPGYTFGSVTDKISADRPRPRTPAGWYIGFGACSCS